MQMEHEIFLCSKLYGWEYTWPEYIQLADLFFDDVSEDLYRPTSWLKGRALREIAELIIRAADSPGYAYHV